MLEFIYSVQSYLANEGTSINSIIALFFGLIAFMLTGYLIESELNKSDKGEWSNTLFSIIKHLSRYLSGFLFSTPKIKHNKT